ncbi:MAG: Gfo/Idh/MocA family oxidoreductase [Sphaerochaetaceae bacterium]|jgi:myo-inositol 2-dehydrogenase/D-chiro-inositol 1-dehydrogenase/scyllo-inositol 2-dehydrogenase (NAD+)
MVNICVIGSGRAGLIHARNFIGRVDNAKLVALCDPVPTALEAASNELGVDKRYTDYHQVLEDPSIDAVVVVTPTVFHRDIVCAAAEAKKHILCEKPMAMNEKECLEMNVAAEKHGVKLQIGFMRRFDASFRYAKQQIESGVIGDIVLVKSVTHGPSVPQPWMYDIAKSNGPLAEVSSHDIDTMHWYGNSYIDEVYAIAGNYRSSEAKKDFPDFYDNVVLSARFLSGAQGILDGAQGVRYGYDARVEILGTHGIIHVGRNQEHSVMTISPEGIRSPYVQSWRTLFLDAYLEEDKAFVSSIIKDTAPLVTGLDGLEAVRVVNAGNTSIKERQPVKIHR